MASGGFTYTGGVVNSVSNYRKIYYKRKYKNGVPPESDAAAIQSMLEEYHTEGTTEERRIELKHDILMRAYFLFPHYLKRNYFFTAELFNEAVQNMAANTLQAIDLFKPELGFPFSNYLIGYFRDAAAKTLRSCNIVSEAALRQAALDASLPPEESGAGENPYIVSDGTDADPDDDRLKRFEEGSDATDMPRMTGSDDENDMESAQRLCEDGTCVSSDCAVPLDEPLRKKQRVIRGASRVFGNTVELDDSREYALAAGHEKELDFDERIHKTQLLEWLEEALSHESGLLTEDERYVLIHHYGLFGNKQMKYDEIAKMRRSSGRGAACSRISQINTAAVNKVRQYFWDNEVEE